MSTLSDETAYSYARFLVRVFPDDAIDILRTKGTRDIMKLVEEQVDSACIKLGNKSRIKGMVEEGKWADLEALKDQSVNGGLPFHPATSSGGYHHIEAQPPTPSSTASRSPHLPRISNQEVITVLYGRAKVFLTSKPSGSDEYFIGEDKLDRIPGLATIWVNPPKQLNLGGKPIKVAQCTQLVWNYGEGATFSNNFWVISAGQIRLADVLLGNLRNTHRSGRPGEAMTSPLSLPQAPQIPPHAPSPLQHVLHQPGRGSSYSAIPSVPGNTIHDEHSRNKRTMPSHLPLPTFGKSPTMISESGIYHDHKSGYGLTSLEGPPSPRKGSTACNRTAGSNTSDIVLIQLSFRGKGKKLVPLDLTKFADEVRVFFDSHISTMTAGSHSEISIYTLEIFPNNEDTDESHSTSLSDLDYSWGAMVEFMKENRIAGTNKPEFRIAIS